MNHLANIWFNQDLGFKMFIGIPYSIEFNNTTHCQHIEMSTTPNPVIRLLWQLNF